MILRRYILVALFIVTISFPPFFPVFAQDDVPPTSTPEVIVTEEVVPLEGTSAPVVNDGVTASDSTPEPVTSDNGISANSTVSAATDTEVPSVITPDPASSTPLATDVTSTEIPPVVTPEPIATDNGATSVSTDPAATSVETPLVVTTDSVTPAVLPATGTNEPISDTPISQDISQSTPLPDATLTGTELITPTPTQSVGNDPTQQPNTSTTEVSLLGSDPGTQILATIPNDPNFSLQYGLVSIHAPQGWDYSTGSSTVIVAVVDTGVDLTHPDLMGNLIGGYDFVQGNTTPMDANGHGTHVAGTIAAVTNNNLGVAGVSWQAEIMPVRVLDASGSGSIDTLINGIDWAVANGADVINLSLGIPLDPVTATKLPILQAAIQNAINNGVVVVAAAGNSNSSVLYPAVYPDVIAVAASDSTDTRWASSNYGPEVDVTAPGVNIYSTALGGTYIDKTGTSMSAAFVSGEAAILVGLRPDLSPSQIAYVIEHSARDIGAPGVDDYTGYGLIQLDAAITMAINMPHATIIVVVPQNSGAVIPQTTVVPPNTVIPPDDGKRGFTPANHNISPHLPPTSNGSPVPTQSPVPDNSNNAEVTIQTASTPASEAGLGSVHSANTEKPGFSSTGIYCGISIILLGLLLAFFLVRRKQNSN